MGRILAFIAAEIALLVTPMIWPTIPFEYGMLIYRFAVTLAVIAVIMWCLEKKEKTEAGLPSVGSVEILVVRKDIARIKDMLLEHNFRAYREDLILRHTRLRDSDLLAWQQDTLRSLRADFLNRAGILISDLADQEDGKRPVESDAGRRETKGEMADFAMQLDSALKAIQ